MLSRVIAKNIGDVFWDSVLLAQTASAPLPPTSDEYFQLSVSATNLKLITFCWGPFFPARYLRRMSIHWAPAPHGETEAAYFTSGSAMD